MTKEDQNIELIKKYKELLDMGAITQEEFDQKKNSCLNNLDVNKENESTISSGVTTLSNNVNVSNKENGDNGADKKISKRKIVVVISAVFGLAFIIFLVVLISNKNGSISNAKIDYENEQIFEDALNDGEQVVGKVVVFRADELHPDSALGYNIWSGEHLNFITDGDPGILQGEEVTAKVLNVTKHSVSWRIYYEVLSHKMSNKEYQDEIIEEKTERETKKEKTTEKKTEAKKERTTEKKTESTTEATTEAKSEESYYENDTFEVTYKTLYNNILNDSTIIHKVYASKTKDVEATVIGYDLNGNVIGKATDEIELVEGQYNYFRYHFSTDVSNATFEVKVQIKDPSYLRGEEDAVELVTSSDDGFHLFLTFKQVKPTFGEFAKFKILYIKDGQVIGDADGYYSVYAENLAGQDTTDVAKLLMDVDSYDHIEYFFEP